MNALMKMRTTLAAMAIASLLFFLTGCSSQDNSGKGTLLGALFGAGAGAAIGGAANGGIGAGVGAVVGAVGGAAIGTAMENGECRECRREEKRKRKCHSCRCDKTKCNKTAEVAPESESSVATDAQAETTK